MTQFMVTILVTGWSGRVLDNWKMTSVTLNN